MTHTEFQGAGSGRGLRFAFVSSNFTWGGSEDLWSETAAALAAEGHRIIVYKNRLSPGDGNVAILKSRGCKLVELARFPLLPNRLYSLAMALARHASIIYQAAKLSLNLRLRRRPDLVVISQGGNHDGWLLATICRRLELPYVLICQKATDLYWPEDRFLHHVRGCFEEARHAFFVSHHNLRLTEEQIGRSLEHASIVRNPFKVAWDVPASWPDASAGYKLACVGRIFPKEKGQDMLLRILATDKWRHRPVTLTIFGSGAQQQALQGMADHLRLSSVTFAGFTTDISAVWAEHHALALPSRAEGLPLVLVEAMLSGRVPIASDVAGNPEVVEEGETGFLGSPTEASFEAAMERAWQRREEWPKIGARAASSIRNLVPSDPVEAFKDLLLRIAAGENIEGEGEKPPR